MIIQRHKTLMMAALIGGGLVLAAGDLGAQEPIWKRVRGKVRGEAAPAEANQPMAADEPTSETARPAEGPAEDVALEAPGEASAEPAAESTGSGPIGLPQAGGKAGNLNLGSESAESGVVKSVLEDESLRSMLGQDPRFIYASNARPDPMVYPPIRREAIRSELESKALAILQQVKFADWVKNGDLPSASAVKPEAVSQAMDYYRQILALQDTRFSANAERQIASILQFQSALGMKVEATPESEITLTPSPTPELVLPIEIESNTLGVLAAPGGSIALIGDALVKEGEPVPGFPEVTVAQIGASQVTYEVSIESQSKRFDVEVKGYLDIDQVGDLKQLRNKKTTTRKRR